jgi:hypothetical protein
VSELVFEVTQEADGGFVAEALGESIITDANTWDELRANVREAVTAFYFGGSEGGISRHAACHPPRRDPFHRRHAQ